MVENSLMCYLKYLDQVSESVQEAVGRSPELEGTEMTVFVSDGLFRIKIINNDVTKCLYRFSTRGYVSDVTFIDADFSFF